MQRDIENINIALLGWCILFGLERNRQKRDIWDEYALYILSLLRTDSKI